MRKIKFTKVHLFLKQCFAWSLFEQKKLLQLMCDCDFDCWILLLKSSHLFDFAKIIFTKFLQFTNWPSISKRTCKIIQCAKGPMTNSGWKSNTIVRWTLCSISTVTNKGIYKLGLLTFLGLHCDEKKTRIKTISLD